MPAPARAAPILARYAAPVKPCDPASTTTVPKVPLCPSRGRAGSRKPSGSSAPPPRPSPARGEGVSGSGMTATATAKWPSCAMLTSISRPVSVVAGATCTCGRPSSLGKISTSRMRGRGIPLGIALPMASLAAQRPAQRSGLLPQYAISRSLRNLRRKRSPKRFWASAMRGIAATSTPTRGVTRLLYGDAFRQVPRLVDVAAPLAGHEVREELQGHHVGNGRQELGDRRDLDPVELHLAEGVVALADQGDYRRIASDHFLDVADHLLESRRPGRDGKYREIAIQQCDRSMLELAGCVSLGMEIRDLFEF